MATILRAPGAAWRAEAALWLGSAGEREESEGGDLRTGAPRVRPVPGAELRRGRAASEQKKNDDENGELVGFGGCGICAAAHEAPGTVRQSLEEKN